MKISEFLSQRVVQEALRFALVGVVATAIHYGIYRLLLPYIDGNIAYTLGYGVSFVVNFILSARFSFKSEASVKRGVGFSLSHLVNYGLHMVLLNAFIAVGIGEALAPIPTYMIAIPVNFILVRFVFTSRLFNKKHG